MPTLTRIRLSEYHDSVTLMLVANALAEMEGIRDAAVVMGTPANRQILAASGLLSAEATAARPDDLVIAVSAGDRETAERALSQAEILLRKKLTPGETAATRAHSMTGAIAAHPDANLAVISVAGRYAAEEARTALSRGLNVLLFSDNVPLAEEIALKQLAREKDLLCMGPDAGTALINGVALGFANAVPRGDVGLVGASGTGLQGVMCGLARRGAGVSQAIGVGGRDLSEPVGGLMTLQGLGALQSDPDTELIVVVSKPPAASVARMVLAKAAESDKPTIVCFLGADPAPIEATGAIATTNLTEAAVVSAALARQANPYEELAALDTELRALFPLAEAEHTRLRPDQRALRGLFAGGTFCYEAQLVLSSLLAPVLSNAPLVKANRLPDSNVSIGHTCIDLGEDEFTQGRLHPMIDPALRNRRMVVEAEDPQTAVILLDIVLGYGAHPDPAGAAGEGILAAQRVAGADGRHIAFVASVCGTEADPQQLSRQEQTLRQAGVLVVTDNAAAARLAGLIAQAQHG